LMTGAKAKCRGVDDLSVRRFKNIIEEKVGGIIERGFAEGGGRKGGKKGGENCQSTEKPRN